MERDKERKRKQREAYLIKRKERKAERITRTDQEILGKRQEKRKKEIGKEKRSTEEKSELDRSKPKTWVSIFRRREKYEEKLSYERWEARELWTKAVKDPKGYRRKGNQVGRTEWIQERRTKKETSLRYYERKPKEYKTLIVETETQEEKTKEREEGKRDSTWGFWKIYHEEEGKRVEEWKKTVLHKKSRGGGSLGSWDRSRYREEKSERNQRRSVTQDQRVLREKEKRPRQGKVNEETLVERERKRERPKEKEREKDPRRTRTYEALQNPGERKPLEGWDPEKQAWVLYSVEVLGARKEATRWEEGKALVKVDLVMKKRQGKRKFGTRSFEEQKEKKKTLRREGSQREATRYHEADAEESRKQTWLKEKARKQKQRKTFLKKSQSRQKKSLIWSPYGKRLQRYGYERKEKKEERTSG